MPASIPALINPSVLEWARKESGYGPELVAKRLQVRVEKLLAWEHGDSKPTVRQAQALAKFYHRPFGVFFLPQPPSLPPVAAEYRRLPGIAPGTESPELRLAIRVMSHRRDVSLELIGELDHPIAEFKKRYPAIHAHLEQFKEDLAVRDRAETGIRYEWYALARPRYESHKEFEQPKIIYPNICAKNAFAWDDEKFYANQKTFIITGGSKFLLGVLNSTVVMWLFWRLIPRLQNGFFEPGAKFLREFPIPAATPEKQKTVVRLVDRILAAKQRDAEADVSALEREIDRLVYKLYDLTHDEIQIVETSARR